MQTSTQDHQSQSNPVRDFLAITCLTTASFFPSMAEANEQQTLSKEAPTVVTKAEEQKEAPTPNAYQQSTKRTNEVAEYLTLVAVAALGALGAARLIERITGKKIDQDATTKQL